MKNKVSKPLCSWNKKRTLNIVNKVMGENERM